MSRDMPDETRDRRGRSPQGQSRGGPTARFTAAFHRWRARRHGHAPPASDTGGRPPAAGSWGGLPAATADGAVHSAPAESTLWRMRTTVRDEPGALAAL